MNYKLKKKIWYCSIEIYRQNEYNFKTNKTKSVISIMYYYVYDKHSTNN